MKIGNRKLEIGNRAALSGWPMIVAWLGMLIFALHACTRMVGAGDTWVAMACGRHFINHGVDTIEPFSANSHKAGPTEEEIKTWPKWAQWITDKVGLETVKYWHPTGWVNQNWLTHVIFYWLTHLSPFADADTFSFNTLVYWKFTIYILAVICVYYMGRLLGVNPALSAVFACFAMFTGRSYFDIRPAGFSNLLTAVFLLVLALVTYRNILYIWLIVPLAVFWCNVHGGYIYMFIMLIPFTGIHLFTSCSKKRALILYNATAWPFFLLVLLKKNLDPQTISLLLVLTITMELALIFAKENLVSIRFRGLIHTAAAGLTAFVAMVIFNPFHLTNLTHTFVISVSKHAEKWRTINEWHPSFEWHNPVGTSFPFLVLCILSIGLPALWLLSHFLKPKLLKAPKNELEAQKKLFTILSKIFGCATAVLICWVVFISFSFLSLDIGSFFICTVFAGIVLLSVYKNVHFIYFIVPLTLLAIWSADTSAGFLGRYIYPFVLLPAYAVTHIIASLLSKTIKLKPKNIIFVAATAITALILMTVLFNPFKFESPVWNVSQFLNLHRMWRPVYERNPILSYTHLFTALYIINVVSVIVWLTIPNLQKLFAKLPKTREAQLETDTYELPKIDLALIVIAALTIYMAIRSRRFIPIAAIAACPIIAMLIDRMSRIISAAYNFHRNNRFIVPPMPYPLQLFFISVGTVAVVGLGTWWTLKFKRIYLDPWHNDPKLTSIFMRMTASDVKPFYACKFIKDNKMQGKMFNYWTEGGFIGYGQQPDPNTGKTPLQLFMDGRAQAAYDRKAYDVWANIMFGGPAVQRANIRKEKYNYAEIGKWIGEQLRRHNVWVVLMPVTPNTNTFVKALEHNRNWPIVFLNGKQKLFVDIKSAQGKKFFENMIYEKLLYPGDFSRHLTVAHNLYLFGKGEAAHKKGLEAAFRALRLNPSAAPMLEIIFAGQKTAELRPLVYNFIRSYLDDFAKYKSTYAKQNGYLRRIIAARLASEYLQEIAEKQGNTKLVQSYGTMVREYNNEIKRVGEAQRW